MSELYTRKVELNRATNRFYEALTRYHDAATLNEDAAEKRIAELEAELADRDSRPVMPAPADLPSDEALAEVLHEAYECAWPEHYTGDPSWPKLHDKAQRSARIAQARAAKEMLEPWLREKAPPADLPSDEALGKVLFGSYWWKTDVEDRWRTVARAAKQMLAPWLRARHIDAAELERLANIFLTAWSTDNCWTKNALTIVLKDIGFTVEYES